jgi:MFS family permease
LQSPLSIIEFRFFLAARFLFIVPLRMASVAVGWYIYKLTGDPLSVGLLGLSEVIPAVSFALYAGHVVDKSDKRKLLLQYMSLYLGACILLVFFTSAYAGKELSKSAVEWCIYGCVFLTGLFRAFSGPAFNAILPQIVQRDMLTRAITWSGTSWQTAAVVGPILAGFLIAAGGITITMIVAVALCILSVVAMFFIAPKPISNTNTTQRTWESVKEGLQFVFKTKELLGAISLDLFAVFFGGAVAMLPVYAADILKVNAAWFGLLNAAQNIGTILILIILTFRPIKQQQGRILLWCVAGFGVMIIVFGLSTSFWLSFIALFISGIMDGISVIIRSTIMQLLVPDEMRGRVSAVNSMFINSSNELGQFESGFAANKMGTVPSVVFGGCMTLAVVLITWIKAPRLRKMEY